MGDRQGYAQEIDGAIVFPVYRVLMIKTAITNFTIKLTVY